MQPQEKNIIAAANEWLARTSAAAVRLQLADGKSLYMGSEADIASMLPGSGAAVRGEAVTECGACHGSGRVVRDRDIGTDQECWVCDGSGVDDEAVDEPVSARAADAPSEPRKLAKLLRDAIAQNVTPFPAQILAAADALDSQPTDEVPVSMSTYGTKEACEAEHARRASASQESIGDDERFLKLVAALKNAEGRDAEWDVVKELARYIDSRAPAAQAASVAVWISVEDRLPPLGEQVIAYRPTAALTQDPPTRLVRFTGNTRESWQGVSHGFDCMCHPSHWMPLPPAPQQEGSEASNG